jgi:hypothetical protein
MSNIYTEQYAAPSAAAHMAAVAGNTPIVSAFKPSQTITDDRHAVLEAQLVSRFERAEITAAQFIRQSKALVRLKLQNVLA